MKECTADVPESRLYGLHEKIEKLNRRAAKLGVAPIVLIEGTPFTKEITETWGDPPRTYFQRVVTVTMKGETPKLSGWSLVAVLTFHEEAGNIIKLVPNIDVELPMKYRNSDTSCDHCQTNRRRNELFVVHHEDGTFKQVGRDCLTDFLGGVDPAALVANAEYMIRAEDLLREAEEEGPKEGMYYGPNQDWVRWPDYLIHVATMVRTHGWVSMKQAREDGERGLTRPRVATSNEAHMNLVPPTNRYQTVTPNDADRALALAAIEWASQIDPLTTDNYLGNLRVLAKCGAAIKLSELGIAASMIVAYQRATGQKILYGKTGLPDARLSQHVGKVGDRLDIKVTVYDVRLLESVYTADGKQLLAKMVDDKGNIFTWFASDSSALQLEDVVWLRGTVKSLNEFRGCKETVLTRCKVLKKCTDAAAVAGK